MPTAHRGPSVGTPGPDAGFALRLARRYEDELRLGDGEAVDDVMVGCALIAARRAALVGRAPCIYDVQLALALWGFLIEAPQALRDARRAAFGSVAHDYVAQRALVDAMDEETLRLTPAEAHARVQRGEPIVPSPVAEPIS